MIYVYSVVFQTAFLQSFLNKTIQASLMNATMCSLFNPISFPLFIHHNQCWMDLNTPSYNCMFQDSEKDKVVSNYVINLLEVHRQEKYLVVCTCMGLYLKNNLQTFLGLSLFTFLLHAPSCPLCSPPQNLIHFYFCYNSCVR